MKITYITPLAIACFGFAMTNTSQAAMAVSNLQDDTTTGLSFGGTDYLAVSFTTGNIATQMSRLEFNTRDGIGTTSATVAIYDALDSESKLQSWEYNMASGGQTFPVEIANFNLSASTTYFLVFSSTDTGNNSNIAATESDAETVGDTALVGSGWSIGDTHWISNDEGANWTEKTYATGQIQINVAAVPEPSSLALLGLGGLALILRRKK